MIKKEKGLTLISLSIAVIIVLVITGMIVYSAKDSLYIKNLTNMQNDISNLRDKVSIYYSEYGDIPVKTEYTEVTNLENAGVLGANDTGRFFILELDNLEGLTLNYGKDYEKYKANQYTNLSELTDIYIINETSNNIFYVQGINVKENDTSKMYYTDYTEGDKEAVEIIEVKQVQIPDGFYYVGGTKESGIVISDDKEDENRYENQEIVGTDLQGNQYVWVPVDGILGENGTINDVTSEEKKILLGRYNFNEAGIPSECSEDYKEENSNDTENLLGYGNTIANNIEEFIDSVRTNGGYYIARFEASREENDKVQSKYDQTAWSETTQPNSAIACQNLYTEITSDLINSYAWDTAILFIQKYGQANYSVQEGKDINSSKQTTGLSGDVQLNIYDMASNCYEWTTETYNENENPCVYRGGNYDDNDIYSSSRGNLTSDSNNTDTSFRPILYFNND